VLRARDVARAAKAEKASFLAKSRTYFFIFEVWGRCARGVFVALVGRSIGKKDGRALACAS
jgi:hypothetical protein